MLDSQERLGRILEQKESYLQLAKISKDSYLVRLVHCIDVEKISAGTIKLTEDVAKEYKWTKHVQSGAQESVARLIIKNLKYLTEKNVIINIRKK